MVKSEFLGLQVPIHQSMDRIAWSHSLEEDLPHRPCDRHVDADPNREFTDRSGRGDALDHRMRSSRELLEGFSATDRLAACPIASVRTEAGGGEIADQSFMTRPDFFVRPAAKPTLIVCIGCDTSGCPIPTWLAERIGIVVEAV